MERKISTGKTTFGCRNCQTVTVVENTDFEEMAKFKCPGCGVPMTDARFARLKILYYAKVYEALTLPPFGGEGPELFQVTMDFDPHYTF